MTFEEFDLKITGADQEFLCIGDYAIEFSSETLLVNVRHLHVRVNIFGDEWVDLDVALRWIAENLAKTIDIKE